MGDFSSTGEEVVISVKTESQSQVFTTGFIIQSIGIENQFLIVNTTFILENPVVYILVYMCTLCIPVLAYM